MHSTGTSAFETENSHAAHLYRLYAAKLLSYLRRHLPCAEDAEDLLLEVFIVVLKNDATLAKMREDERRAWLWRVARNKFIDHHRSAHTRYSGPLDEATELLPTEQKGPEETFLHQEELETLHAFLRRLPAPQQEILMLRFFGELSCPEIATVLGKREGAIRTMLSRTLKTLRSLLKRGNIDG